MAALRATKEGIERERPITAEEFARMPESNERYELIRGVIVQKPMPKTYHSRIQFELGFLYRMFDPQKEIGEMLPEVTFELDTNYSLTPDLSFWQKGRTPKNGDDYAPTPDLAIEIQSKGQSIKKLTEKVQDYLAVGVRLAWVILPNNKQVGIFRPGQAEPEIVTLKAGGVLDGEDVIPGFRVKLADLF